VDGTSALSAHLKYGELHPRTLLADLGSDPGEGAERYRFELCWRDFYADVLWHEPASAREDLRPALADMTYDDGPLADERFTAWADGRTGFPFVDAGMRQLRATGWVHNRARMVVASFLVKDLHLPWQRGARHFMHWLRDGDLASNMHGWQWVAGTGTDAAPYFRIFNPVKQGLTFDPDGEYVRRWVPELRGVPGAAAHEPWLLPGGLPDGYPARVVDHSVERAEALRRYEAARSGERVPATAR
jgi:deoxyribodipyrimidine photo-lyase